MAMHNLSEYSLNYSEMTGTLWFYSKDESTNFNDITKTDAFISLRYRATLSGSKVAKPAPNQANGFLKDTSSPCSHFISKRQPKTIKTCPQRI